MIAEYHGPNFVGIKEVVVNSNLVSKEIGYSYSVQRWANGIIDSKTNKSLDEIAKNVSRDFGEFFRQEITYEVPAWAQMDVCGNRVLRSYELSVVERAYFEDRVMDYNEIFRKQNLEENGASKA